VCVRVHTQLEGVDVVAVDGREGHEARLPGDCGRDGLDRGRTASRRQRRTASSIRRRHEDEQDDDRDETERRRHHHYRKTHRKLVRACRNTSAHVARQRPESYILLLTGLLGLLTVAPNLRGPHVARQQHRSISAAGAQPQ